VFKKRKKTNKHHIAKFLQPTGAVTDTGTVNASIVNLYLVRYRYFFFENFARP